MGEVTRRTAEVCQVKAWRGTWGAGERVSTREENMPEGSMNQMYGRPGKGIISLLEVQSQG